MKKSLLILVVLFLIAGGVKAADPDYTWREAVRAVIGTNGIKAGVVHASALDSNIVTNVFAEGMVLPAVDGNAVTNLNAANLAAGSVLPAVDGNAVTNLDAANLTAGSVLPAVSGASVTNLSPATAFPGYAVCTVTNLDVDGTTNILTYIGTIAREQ